MTIFKFIGNVDLVLPVIFLKFCSSKFLWVAFAELDAFYM